MTPRDFCYWLQGTFEVLDPATLTAHQVSIIKNHLNLVFVHSIDAAIREADRPGYAAVHDGKSGLAPNLSSNSQARC